MEIPDSVLMEDNSNVEKAEAYMKELENVSDLTFLSSIDYIICLLIKMIQFTGFLSLVKNNKDMLDG